MKKTDRELFKAIELNDAKKLKECIAAGADIEAKDKNDWTPLMCAALAGALDCCKTLIDAGADINIKNDSGWTPLMLAARNNCSDCCKTLIDAGADIEAKHNYGWTPLMFAAREGNLDCCKMLIDTGADIEAKNINGWAPLMFAACNGYSECCETLIDAGADIEAKNNFGWTSLIHAANNGCLDCCKILIDARALITPKNDRGKIALDYAIECDFKNIIELLKPLITPERELTEHILLNQDIENEVFNNVRIEKMPTINPYYILTDMNTNVPVGTFTPNKGLDGLEIYDGYQTLDEAIDNVRNPMDTEVVDNII